MYQNYIITKEGSVVSLYTGKQVYVHTNKKGYQFVRLYVDGKAKTYLVHRLVAEMHIPNPDKLPQVNHLDGNKSNNVYWNLEWCSCQHNVTHSVVTGLVKRGDNRPNAKLTDKQVIDMRSLRAQGASYYELGRLFGVAYQTAHKVCSNQTYTHI